MNFFKYGEKEIGWLKNRDKVLGKFIERTGTIERKIYPAVFLGLCRSIIGQQLGNSALESIWSRFTVKFPLPLPRTLAHMDLDEIRECGISQNKAYAIKEAARQFASGELSGLHELSDREISAKLLPIKGIGQWTVDMLLIFTFQRKNIASFGDFALKKGLCNIYGHSGITKEVFSEHMKTYAPYATIASFYLWEAASIKKN